MSILQFIATRNFIVVNKELMHALGLEEAILLGELCSEYDFWEKQGRLEDGFFYSTVENIEENTTLSDYQQRKYLNKLCDLGIIEIKIKGMPAKRFIRICEEEVFKIFEGKNLKNLRTSTGKNEEPHIYNNIINKNKKIKIKKEVYAEIVDYLNEKIGARYSAKSSKTQTLINARMNEGFTLEDFKTVIDKKCNDWLKDTKMSKYLRPETLFGTKFEGYLNEIQKKKTLPSWYQEPTKQQPKYVEPTSESLKDLEDFFKNKE